MANGEGYIRQRSNGSYTLTISLGRDEKGKARQLVRTIHGTEKEAKGEMARLIAERDRGIDLKPQNVTFSDLKGRWLETRSDLAPSTAATYEILLRLYAVPVLGKYKLRDIKPLHIEAVKNGVIAKGRSQKLALNVFRLVNAIFKQAVRWQLLSHNPCDAVLAPRAKRFTPHTPTPEDLERLLRVVDETSYGPVARLAALTGARQAELLALRWSDVDWQRMLLSIRGTKTAGSLRTIELGPLAIELLTAHRKTEREKKLLLGPEADCGGDAATIFTNLVGKPMDAGGLKRTWQRVIKKAGVGHVRFHDLRHATATYLLQAGVPIQMVSQRLGHTRPSTTTDIYAHVLPGMGRHAAETLEGVMVNGWSKAKEG